MGVALHSCWVAASSSLALNPSLRLPGATMKGKQCMNTFPNATIKHGKQRLQPNTRTSQRSIHELITSRLRNLLSIHFEENSTSTPEGRLFTPQESTRWMIVFPAQPYNGRRGLFYISDRYAAFQILTI